MLGTVLGQCVPAAGQGSVEGRGLLVEGVGVGEF